MILEALHFAPKLISCSKLFHFLKVCISFTGKQKSLISVRFLLSLLIIAKTPFPIQGLLLGLFYGRNHHDALFAECAR